MIEMFRKNSNTHIEMESIRQEAGLKLKSGALRILQYVCRNFRQAYYSILYM